MAALNITASGGTVVSKSTVSTAAILSQRLMYLLTYVDPGPIPTKKGTPRVHQPKPHKDQTAKFYEAQLIHYGLEPRKGKQAAKKALLAAAGIMAMS